ncbi:MAG: ATP-binding cassette domain-containing protein, partial [Clostridia bacterium]|nr:ATP-binding cassette domain-containing protein [Clostridia bacterium]
NILILDEPTAVLTPQEIEKLFNVLRAMRNDGKAILLITHKLNEVMEISDVVAVLRKGQHIKTVRTAETNPQALTDMMVGRSVTLNINRTVPVDPKPRLTVAGLTVRNSEGVTKLNDVGFIAYSGEILGIAGITGSGQKELLEAVAGLIPTMSGSSMIYIDPKTGKEEDLKKYDAEQIRALGIRLAFVPEDRLGMGLVGSMNIPDNMMLRSYKEGKFGLTDRVKPKKLAEKVVEELEVAAPDLNTPVRKLSGGNVQKVLVGRELASDPSLMMAAYAVRGLDINTSYAIYHLLNDQKLKGSAVIYVGEDLDVLIELCDRIMVLCAGRITGIVDGRTANKEQIGLMMAGAEQK